MADNPPSGESSLRVLGSAPRAESPASTVPTEAHPEAHPDALATASERGASALVTALVRSFQDQVRRALKAELDGSITSLAYVDYYVSLARDEDREPIVSLLAAGAGAYFGELVRREMGGTWVGDGEDPRRLRLLLEPQFVHFSPVDQAYEAIAGTGLEPNDPRLAPGPAFDSGFGLRPEDPDDPTEDEASWLSDRLAELPPVPEDQFHSLTCRFETLQLMLELLAARQVAEGLPPRRLSLADYVEVLSRSAD